LQVWRERLGHPQVAQYIGCEGALDAFRRGLATGGRDACIVDEHVQRPSPLVGCGTDRGVSGDVGEHVAHGIVAALAPNALYRPLRAAFVPGEQYHLVARRRREGPGNRTADDAGGAGDEGDGLLGFHLRSLCARVSRAPTT
jgi:hypothetical protein